MARQARSSIEVYLLRRSTASAAFPGCYVFPGGIMEADDRDTAFWLQHVDLPADRLAGTLGGPVEALLPFAVAAIRETFEEAGLLIAQADPGIDGAHRFHRGGLSFRRLVGDGGCRLATSRLAPWARWISPPSMPHRFETCFFVVPVEPDRHLQPDYRETLHGTWVAPAAALAGNASGAIPLSPPTLVTLHQFLRFATVRELITAARERSLGEPLTPRLWPLEEGGLIVEPWDPDYRRESVVVDVDGLPDAILPPEAPFSRLWMHRGRYLPVRRPDGG